MKCPDCDFEVYLVYERDKETDMLQNYWKCDEHGKVDPTKSMSRHDIDSLVVSDEYIEAFDKYIKGIFK